MATLTDLYCDVKLFLCASGMVESGRKLFGLPSSLEVRQENLCSLVTMVSYECPFVAVSRVSKRLFKYKQYGRMHYTSDSDECVCFSVHLVHLFCLISFHRTSRADME